MPADPLAPTQSALPFKPMHSTPQNAASTPSARTLKLLSFALPMLLAAGCRPPSGAGAHAPGAGAPPPPSVSVSIVEEKPITEFEELSGRLGAVDFVEIRPRVSGHIQEVRFKAGERVRKGDVLFIIDPRWHQAEFDRASAAVKSAEVRLQTATREANRVKALLADRAISAEDADARQSRLEEAQAGLNAAQAALAAVSLDLEFTQVRSPIDGRASRAYVTPGNHVSGVAGANTLLTTVVSIDPIHLYVDMDETTLLRFQRLMRDNQLPSENGRVPVHMALGEESEFSVVGWVESLDNRLDPASGAILLRATFPNPDGNLIPGLYARVRVPVSPNRPVVLISDRAVGTDQSQKFVLTLTQTNTVAYRPVKLGPIVNGQRVIREGLKPGDKVIVNGLQKVRPGMPVTVEAAPSATGATGGSR